MTSSNIFLHAFASGMTSAGDLALKLGAQLHAIDVHHFPDGEILPTVTSARGVHAIYCSLDRPNEKLITLFLVADALKRGGATKIILVAPYLCYMRQDTQFAPGQPISQLVVGRLISQHFDAVITVDAHLHRMSTMAQAFSCYTMNLSATQSIGKWLVAQDLDRELVVTGPDQESEQWVRPIAEAIARPWSVMKKTRSGDRSVEICVAQPDIFSDKQILLIDDVCSTSGTLVSAAKALKAVGAKKINAIVTHALFDSAATASMIANGIENVVSTNSIEHPTNRILLTDILASALASTLEATQVE